MEQSKSKSNHQFDPIIQKIKLNPIKERDFIHKQILDGTCNQDDVNLYIFNLIQMNQLRENNEDNVKFWQDVTANFISTYQWKTD